MSVHQPVARAHDASGSPMRAWLAALERTAALTSDPTRTLPVVIDDWAERAGDTPALVSERESLTFGDLAHRSNRWGRWALGAGLRRGDIVALLMPNRPEYIAVWLGLARVGVVTALVNAQLSGRALAHCLALARARHAIVDATLAEAYAEAAALLESAPPCLVVPPVGDRSSEGNGPAGVAPTPLEAPDGRPVTLADRALLIYTSGTTGLPKAAVVSHRRILTWSGWFAGLAGLGPSDRMYDCLPLYHSVGGVVAVGSALLAGGSVAVAERFSARGFWDDVVRWDCTTFQYIGELPRYLLKSPPTSRDTHHRVRLCIGNGLKGDVWRPFQQRFAIPRILEFYAATEGTFSLFNVEGRPGSIGRIPPFLAHRFPAAIVRFDVQAGAPVRDADGFCIRCGPDEPGEAIGLISERGARPAGTFEGYTDPAESERKVLRNVFAEGDAWFRTGDLLRVDAGGFYAFVDRIGDTFRWKGENVSTAEVAETLRRHPGVGEAEVYGVAVPGADGRAGMAALVAEPDLDLGGLASHVASALPAYARPVFLRLVAEVDLTATFKPRKADLVAQGFDPAVVADPLFVLDAKAVRYVPLDAAAFVAIADGSLRL